MKTPINHRNTRGFALPLTIFLVAFITLILAAAFARSAAERLVAESFEDHVTAESIAESGLNAFFHDTVTARPASGDSIRYNVPGGYAWVFAEELRKPADTVSEDIMYVIRSTGYLIDPNQGSVPQAQMTMSQFARWTTAVDPIVLGAFTTADRLRVRPIGTVAIHGTPSCGGSGPIPSIRAAAGGLIDGANVDSMTGLAPVVQDPDAVVAAATGVRWADINSGNYEADYNGIQLGDSTYSTQLKMGIENVPAGGMGTGILMVEDNLNVSGGSFRWYGLILVGGDADFTNTDTEIHGAIITGLDELIGGTGGRSDVGGTYPWQAPRDFRLYYNPCEINNALASFTGFSRVANSIAVNWATY